MFSLGHKDSISYLTKRDLFSYKNWFRKVNPIYLKTCLFFGTTLIDRTNTIESGFNFNIIDPIPDAQGFNLSFKDVTIKRARKIVSCSQGSLKILWSGGIDSTVALISLKRKLRKRNEIERLIVLLSKESIAEYPRFYNDVVLGKLKTEFIKTNIYDHIKQDETIVTGENGDQLFGSDKLKYCVLGGYAFVPYEEILEYVISRKLGTEKYTRSIIQYLSPQVMKSPVKIITLYDYLWWMNFSLKWQAVSMRLTFGLDRSAIDLENNVFHFFKCSDFEKWSITNHEFKILKEWRSYKYIAKNYIFEFHKDRNYLMNKEKEQSLKEVLVN